MIDIHCHIVPGVDDGPVNVEEAEKMMSIMQEDGISGVVATSHRNHLIDFKPSKDYDASIKEIIEIAKNKYPAFNIYRGAEFFVREGYLEIVDNPIYDFKIQGTNYVLLEFPTDSSYETISDAVYEFSIRGFRPIIAHIDKYRAIWSNEERVENLRREGAYVQITGATLVGKYGKTMKKTMKGLVKKGHVDFIGSDGHSPERRRPLLKRSYRVVARMCSKAEADRIFNENPRTMLAGGIVKKKKPRSLMTGFFYENKLSPAIAIAIFLIGIAIYYFLLA